MKLSFLTLLIALFSIISLAEVESETTAPESAGEEAVVEPTPALEPPKTPSPKTTAPQPAKKITQPQITVPSQEATPSSPVAIPTANETASSEGSPLAWGLQLGQARTEISETGDRTRTSFSAGGFIEFRVLENWAIQAELNYIEKGYYHTGLLPVLDGASLKYLEVPLLIKAKARWNNLAPSIFAGPSLAYLHSATQVDSGVQFDRTSTTTRWDYGVYVGAGLDFILSQNLELGGSIRYGWGLSSIEQVPQSSGIYNRVLHWMGNIKFRF